MKFTNLLFRSGVPLLALQSLATPVPPSFDQQQEPLAVAHAAITEISCAETCLFADAQKNPCADDNCRKSCSSFSAAYWKNIEQCINRECSTQTDLGNQYVKTMKQAVENHCAIFELVFTPSEDEFSAYGGHAADDPTKPPTKPPCDDPGKTKPKKPKKHKDVPPPVRRSLELEYEKRGSKNMGRRQIS